MNIEDFETKFLLRRQDYGVLYPYIVSEDVTDINWNGRQLWIDDLKKEGIRRERYWRKNLWNALPP